MATTAKTFDCVEMKDRIQRRLRQEYEARKGEFGSYGEFIRAVNAESESVRAFRARLAEARTPATDEPLPRGNA